MKHISKRRQAELKIFYKARNEMLQEMFEELGYYVCQHSGRTITGRVSVHHLVYRGEKPMHPELHNKRNLIILDDQYHTWKGGSHWNKHQWRAKYIEERNLTELFGNDILPMTSEQFVKDYL